MGYRYDSMLIMIGDDLEDITYIGWCNSPFEMCLQRDIDFIGK